MIYGDDLKKHPKSAYTKDNEALHFYVKDVRILTPKNNETLRLHS